MDARFLINAFKEASDKLSIVWSGKEITYADLLKSIESSNEFLIKNKIFPGQVIALKGDFTPFTISLLISLINNQNIIVPFNNPMKDSEQVKFEVARVQKTISVDIDTDICTVENTGYDGNHEYYTKLRDLEVSGLVLFSSGTSGVPKGAVHNFQKLLQKFKTQRKSLRTINFLLFDHWGGLNTLLHTLSNCGVVLALYNRKPDFVCKFVQDNNVELLPVSPSFLNLMILSETYKKYDLSSLKLISYGTEPMPETTLKRAKKLFPDVRFQQTYGLIELGVLRSKSKSDDSLWVKLGGEGYDLRVVDNMLEIKAESAILGYLNAKSPFTFDGYFITGDQVEVDGEYYKILGRKSELINVGGDKVYPQEVENVILSMENVMEVTVYGQKHAIMGNIVCVKVILNNSEDNREFKRRLKEFCKDKLQPFKIPVKIEIEENVLHSHRFKKKRKFDK
jgi:acyl-CoA synthetase (AMP-forming)/AMP-acid ligase II